MCHFITIGIPQRASHLLERARKQQGLLHISAWDTSPTRNLFRADYACATVTSGGCSCDLIVRAPKDADAELAKQKARLQRKGLSEAKIRQALDAKAHALTKPNPISQNADALFDVLAMLEENTPGLLLYSHSYRGRIDSEDVPTPGLAAMSLLELRSAGIPDDTLVTIRRLD